MKTNVSEHGILEFNNSIYPVTERMSSSGEGRGLREWRGEASVLHLFWWLQRGEDWSYRLCITVVPTSSNMELY